MFPAAASSHRSLLNPLPAGSAVASTVAASLRKRQLVKIIEQAAANACNSRIPSVVARGASAGGAGGLAPARRPRADAATSTSMGAQ